MLSGTTHYKLSTGLLTGCGKNGKNCGGFWRQIMRDKNLIVRDIVRDCTILRQTKYLVSLSLSKQTFNSSSHTFSFAITSSNSVNLLLDFTSAAFHLIA